jgi:hypothetical protein
MPRLFQKLHRTDLRSFSTRYKEHFRDYAHATPKSKFTEHLLQSHHSIGSKNLIMKPLYLTTKGRFMNTVEKYFICRETQINNQLNDRHRVQPNPIFKTLTHIRSHRGLPPPPRNSTDPPTTC